VLTHLGRRKRQGEVGEAETSSSQSREVIHLRKDRRLQLCPAPHRARGTQWVIITWDLPKQTCPELHVGTGQLCGYGNTPEIPWDTHDSLVTPDPALVF